MGAGSDTTNYTARFLLPDLIERERANVLSCPVYRDGAIAAVTSGTVSIYDRSGTAQVDAAAVTVTGGVPSYTYTPAASLQLGEGWRVVWTLSISGATYEFPNDAALVRHRLHPVVTDADLFRRVSSLDPSRADCISTVTDYQDYLDEAWAMINLRLIGRGSRPNLVRSPTSTRFAHQALTLALIFEDFATRLNAAYAETAKGYRAEYESAWKDLNFQYDSDDSGRADSAKKRRSANPVVMLCPTDRRRW